jgi:hypothetical protein
MVHFRLAGRKVAMRKRDKHMIFRVAGFRPAMDRYDKLLVTT